MNIRKIVFAVAGMFAALISQAQVDAPAPAQSKPIALMNGIAHIGNGQVIENSVVLFKDGKIEMVADARNIRIDLKNYDVRSIEGQHVYPGFILPYTNLGLREIDAVRSTLDEEEVGDFNPNVRALIAYNTDSQITPTVRSNGILVAQVAPRGGYISGTSSVMELDGWNWEDAVLKADDGLWMNWPNVYKRSGWWAEPGPLKPNENYSGQTGQIEAFISEAKAYSESTNDNVNLKLEALKGLFNGSQRLYIRASYAKEIVEAISFAKKMGVQHIVLVQGEDAYYVRDFLKKNNIPVLIANVHRLPERPEEDVDMPYKLPYLLTEAGLKVGLLYDDLKSNRNLPFFAGTAAAYGLGKEGALALVTKNTAEILGIEDRVGTLESTKDATLFVSSGDALDMRTNNVTSAFIQGREINLSNKQIILYKKYKQKYEGSEPK